MTKVDLVSEAWMVYAACRHPDYRDMDFTSEKGEDVVRAKKVCATCLVTSDCLGYAKKIGPSRTTQGNLVGVWGGLAAGERVRLWWGKRR